MGKNKQFNVGHVHKEGHFWYVNLYSCNGRCCGITDKNKIEPELDKCCESVKFMLDKESQKKVKHHQIIYFAILDTVDEILNNYLGLYAQYKGLYHQSP